VQLLPRDSTNRSGFLKKALATWTWTRRVAKRAKVLPVQCVNVHGLSTLLLGVRLKRHLGCRLIYDTHELETKVSASYGLRRIYSERLERALIKYCDAVICVSDGIADWYSATYKMQRPLVVRNVPDTRFQTAKKAAEDLRIRFRIPSSAVFFLYQGRLAPGRQIEEFLDVFTRIPQSHHLIFMGKGEREELIRRAAETHCNIHLASPVPPSEVLGYTTQADVGLVGMEDTCLNHRLSLPNKLFEYIVAGVPVIIPDFPEMRRLVTRYQSGWSWSGGASGFENLVRSLSSEAIRERKMHSLTAGQELSWENEEKDLLDLYQRLLDPTSVPIAEQMA